MLGGTVTGRGFQSLRAEHRGFRLHPEAPPFLAQEETRGKKKSEETRVKRGSANVFADFGRPDADIHMMKATLVSRTDAIIRRSGSPWLGRLNVEMAGAR